jgi:hypothetical protein
LRYLRRNSTKIASGAKARSRKREADQGGGGTT